LLTGNIGSFRELAATKNASRSAADLYLNIKYYIIKPIAEEEFSAITPTYHPDGGALINGGAAVLGAPVEPTSPPA
jgi:hypothetical protein